MNEETSKLRERESDTCTAGTRGREGNDHDNDNNNNNLVVFRASEMRPSRRCMR